MAVTSNGNRIILGAAADAVVGKFRLRSVVLDHSAAATCVLQETNSKQIISFRNTTGTLSQQIVFPDNFWVDGVKASTLSAGTVTLFIG